MRRHKISRHLTPDELPRIIYLVVVLIILLSLKVSRWLPAPCFSLLLCSSSCCYVRHGWSSLLLLSHECLKLGVIELGLVNLKMLLLLSIRRGVKDDLLLWRLHSWLHPWPLLPDVLLLKPMGLIEMLRRHGEPLTRHWKLGLLVEPKVLKLSCKRLRGPHHLVLLGHLWELMPLILLIRPEIRSHGSRLPHLLRESSKLCHHLLLHHNILLILLLLLHHHDLLRVGSPLALLLLIYELHKLFSGHGKYLVELTKHEPLEIFIWDT